MESFLLDESGDIVMKDGDIQLVKSDDELLQTLRTVLRTNLYEWFLDYELGFDYSIITGVKTIDEEALRLALQHVSDQFEEVDRFEDLEVKYDRRKRTARIAVTVVTIEGDELPFEEVF